MPSAKKYNYQPAREFYIYGEWDSDNEGASIHFYPTLEQVQQRFSDISIASIKQTAAKEKWYEQRREYERSLSFKAQKYSAELTKTSENLSELGCLLSKVLLDKVKEIQQGEVGAGEIRMLKDISSIYQSVESVAKSQFRAKRENSEDNSKQETLKKPLPLEPEKLKKYLAEAHEKRRLDSGTYIAYDDPEYIRQYGQTQSEKMLKKHPKQSMEKMERYQPEGDRHHIWQMVQAGESFDEFIDVEAAAAAEDYDPFKD